MCSFGVAVKAFIELILSGLAVIKYELGNNSHFKGRYVVRSNGNIKHFSELPRTA